MEEKKYYILSLKHTHAKDSAFTLYRTGGRGYCWYQQWAGVYGEEEAKANHSPEHSVIMIDKAEADKLMRTAGYEQKEWLVLPNTAKVRKVFNIYVAKLDAAHRSCYMDILTNQLP